ncbi:hypothetical protein ACM7ZP_17325 [Pseudomonas aeruginosa]
MNKANECTCPSGDGSLRHPCPAHPAVEQAGKDERIVKTAPERIYLIVGDECPRDADFGELSEVTWCEDEPAAGIEYVRADKARAALAQPSQDEDMGAAQELAGVKAILNDMADALKRLTFHARTTGGTAGPDAALMNACEHAERVLSLGGMGAAFMRGCDDHEAQGAQPSPALPPFAEKVLAKLRRFYVCAEDFESGGVDIGRHWLDLLTQLGLLNRVQRSPALWEISQQGEDLLGAPQHFPARTEQANSGYDQLWAWFGLSRSAYAVLPRVMMHAMPDDWQRRFAELMDEWDDHWPNQPDVNARVHIAQNGLYISTPKWLLDYRHPDHNQLNAMRGKDEL